MKPGWILLTLLAVFPAHAHGQDDRLKQGKEALAKKDYDAAIAHFTEAIRQDPKNAEAYARRAAARAEARKDHDATIADATEALRLDPKNATAYAARAR